MLDYFSFADNYRFKNRMEENIKEMNLSLLELLPHALVYKLMYFKDSYSGPKVIQDQNLIMNLIVCD